MTNARKTAPARYLRPCPRRQGAPTSSPTFSTKSLREPWPSPSASSGPNAAQVPLQPEYFLTPRTPLHCCRTCSLTAPANPGSPAYAATHPREPPARNVNASNDSYASHANPPSSFAAEFLLASVKSASSLRGSGSPRFYPCRSAHRSRSESAPTPSAAKSVSLSSRRSSLLCARSCANGRAQSRCLRHARLAMALGQEENPPSTPASSSPRHCHSVLGQIRRHRYKSRPDSRAPGAGPFAIRQRLRSSPCSPRIISARALAGSTTHSSILLLKILRPPTATR